MNTSTKFAVFAFLMLIPAFACKKESQIPSDKEIVLSISRWNANTVERYFFTTTTLPSGYSVYDILSVYEPSQWGWTKLDTGSASGNYYKIESDRIVIYSHNPYAGVFNGDSFANDFSMALLQAKDIIFNRVKIVFR